MTLFWELFLLLPASIGKRLYLLSVLLITTKLSIPIFRIYYLEFRKSLFLKPDNEDQSLLGDSTVKFEMGVEGWSISIFCSASIMFLAGKELSGNLYQKKKSHQCFFIIPARYFPVPPTHQSQMSLTRSFPKQQLKRLWAFFPSAFRLESVNGGTGGKV